MQTSMTSNVRAWDPSIEPIVRAIDSRNLNDSSHRATSDSRFPDIDPGIRTCWGIDRTCELTSWTIELRFWTIAYYLHRSIERETIDSERATLDLNDKIRQQSPKFLFKNMSTPAARGCDSRILAFQELLSWALAIICLISTSERCLKQGLIKRFIAKT